MTVSGDILVRTRTLTKHQQQVIYSAHATGHLLKLSSGIYIEYVAFEELPPWDRYLLRCIAVGETHPGYLLAGKSAAALWGMPYGWPPEQVTLAGTHAPGRSRSRHLEHRRLVRGATARDRDGLKLTSPVLTALDIARWHDLPDAVEAVDYALARQWVSFQTLQLAVDQLRGYSGATAAQGAGPPGASGSGESAGIHPAHHGVAGGAACATRPGRSPRRHRQVAGAG